MVYHKKLIEINALEKYACVTRIVEKCQDILKFGG